jgi:hypothetical protein
MSSYKLQTDDDTDISIDSKEHPEWLIPYKIWNVLFVFLMACKFGTFMLMPALLGGGIPQLCDCTDRPWLTPFQRHNHGFGPLYQALVWIHFLMAIVIMIPTLVAMYTPKGSIGHVRGGQFFLFCWFIQIFVGILMGGYGPIARGFHPGGDPAHKDTQHYWGTFPLEVYLLFSFALSSATENLSNAVSAIQFKYHTIQPWHQYTFLLGSPLTILNGICLLSYATLTLSHSSNLGDPPQIYLWLYYFLIVSEIIMAALNFKYWITPEEERDKLWHHVRCMAWSSFLVWFFIAENCTYRLARATGISLWITVPVYLGLVGIFVLWIWRAYVAVQSKQWKNYSTCCPKSD